MILSWFLYLVWACLIAGSLWSLWARDKLGKTNSFVLLIQLATFSMFSYIFIFNVGSNVAQLSESRRLWGIWFDAWIPLVILNLLALAVAVGAVSWAVIRKEKRSSIGGSVLPLFAALSGAYHVLRHMPDA